jgi:vitamin B12 transporter
MYRARALVLLVCLFVPSLVLAQTGRPIAGTVRDTSGAAIPGATVEALVAGRTIASTASASDGTYKLDVPGNGFATLVVRLNGFADQVIEVGANAATTDVTLHVGSVSDSVVVTAARGPESRAKVTQSLTVLSREDLNALGVSEISDALRFSPGTSVEGTGREGGGPTSMFVRGGDSDYNVVLIDGVRSNIDGGRFDFSRVATGEVDRIEIVRGAQSSLWGADAMTSVVQVFTRRAQPADAPELSASLEGGSFGTFRTYAGVTGGAGGRGDYRAGMTYRGTDGAFQDLLTEDDRYRQTAFDASGGLSLGSSASLRAGVRYSDGDGRSVGAITYGARDTGGLYETRDLSVHANVSHALGSRFTGTATVNYFSYEGLSADRVADANVPVYAILTGTPNAIFPNGTQLVRLIDATEFNSLVAAGATPAAGQFLGSATMFDFPFNPAGCESATPSCLTQFRRPAFRYQGDLQWAAGQRLSVGYDWEREKNLSVSGFDNDNSGFFVQQQSSFRDRLFVTIGARYDSKEGYSSYFSPKLSAGGFVIPYRAGRLSSLKLFANFGRGVKSPTFGERFGGSFADPNPDLVVEQAKSGDAGVEATLADSRFRVTAAYFRNDFTDQISYRPGAAGDGVPEYINIDGSRASGVEVEAGLLRPIGGFLAWVTYAFVDSEVVTNQSTSQQFQPGQPLLRRPRNSGSVRAAYTFSRATANVNLRIIGDRFDNSFLSLRTVPNATRPTAITTDITVNPGYVVMGANLELRLLDQLVAYVRGDNVGDTEYDSALGYPGLPRSIVVGARIQFGRR